MQFVSVGELGGVKITTKTGETLQFIDRPDLSVYENLLGSIRYLADLIAGKIENEEPDLVDFIELAHQALTALLARLNNTRVN